jgi:hypothetical protein
MARAAEERHERRRECCAGCRQRAADGERQPQRLRRKLARVGLAAGAVKPRDMRGRRVGEEVAQCDDRRQQRRGQRERRQLLGSEVADDRGVDEQVQRLGRERAERREGETQDLAVVGRAARQGADSTIRP